MGRPYSHRKNQSKLATLMSKKISLSAPMPALIGHRGLPLLAPENTAASIRLAAENNIQWLELDVTMAGDGSLVIMHDDDLKRFGQPELALAKLTEQDLKNVDAGSWFSEKFQGEPLLFFSELLQLISELKVGLNLEIKINPQLAVSDQVEKIYQQLAKWPLLEKDLIISSFNLSALHELRNKNATVKLAPLFEKMPDAVCR